MSTRDDAPREDAWNLIDKTATDLGITAEARRKWRERGIVPHKHRLPMIQKLAAGGIFVGPDFFDHLPSTGTENAASQAAE